MCEGELWKKIKEVNRGIDKNHFHKELTRVLEAYRVAILKKSRIREGNNLAEIWRHNELQGAYNELEIENIDAHRRLGVVQVDNNQLRVNNNQLQENNRTAYRRLEIELRKSLWDKFWDLSK